MASLRPVVFINTIHDGCINNAQYDSLIHVWGCTSNKVAFIL